MLTVYEIRRANLRRLMADWGGPALLSRKLGHSNASYLAQLAGPNPSRWALGLSLVTLLLVAALRVLRS